MNQVELTIAAIMRQDPTISEAEARQMAEAQHAPEARTDGAPSAPLTPDVQLDYPEQKYKYNPVSRTWDDVGAGSSGPGLRPGDRSADTDPRVQSGEFGYRFGGQVPHASADEAADYSTRPAAGPSQQDLDMLQTGDINRSGTGWVSVYGPDGTTRLMRRAPAPETSVRPTQYGRDKDGNPVVLEEGGAYVGDVPMEQSQGYRQPEDTPGANLAAAYSGATGFRDWTVDGGVPEYAQGYDWGGPDPGQPLPPGPLEPGVAPARQGPESAASNPYAARIPGSVTGAASPRQPAYDTSTRSASGLTAEAAAEAAAAAALARRRAQRRGNK